MRNIFDQYSQPENRLTHALVTCLAEDRKLLGQFVRWVANRSLPRFESITVLEQRLPGELELAEAEAERRGLPDAWVHDGDSWSLLIESKIASPLRNEQLRRHYRTAVRRGFSDVLVLAIDVTVPKHKLPTYVRFRSWSAVYTWFVNRAHESEWAEKLVRYMETAEMKMSSEGYLREGTLTVFSGVPFEEHEPYNYLEAKRILRLVMDSLRKRRDLQTQLGMDPKGGGRGAITGKQGVAVWDFLSLKAARGADAFTQYPHLTLAIEADRVLTIVTIPHGIKPSFRRNLIKLGDEGFVKLMETINRSLLKALGDDPGAAPWVIVVQRRYPSQRAAAFIDARLEYDLRTAFGDIRRRGQQPVKRQQEWLIATYETLLRKRSNLQVAIGATFLYRSSKAVRGPELLDRIAKTWISCKPLINTLLG